MKTVIGIDLSLSSTGLAFVDPDIYETQLIKPRARLDGHARLSWLVGAIGEHTQGAGLVVVEGPSYGSAAAQRGHHERAGLWWMVTHQLWLWDVPCAIAPPACLKRYATGRGNAKKEDVLIAVIRRYPAFIGNNDAADALVLAAMGADWLGRAVTDMPKTHRAALDGVAWPTTLEVPNAAA